MAAYMEGAEKYDEMDNQDTSKSTIEDRRYKQDLLR